MSNNIFEIALLVLGAIIAEILSFSIKSIRAYYSNKSKKNILGAWKSVYISDFRDKNTWFYEDIDITRKLDKYIMENKNHPSDDNYVVSASIIENIYMTGTWRSKIIGANATGAIILTITPLGNIMYGFFTGLGDTGERVYCSWVLARKEKELKNGIDLLQKLSLTSLS